MQLNEVLAEKKEMNYKRFYEEGNP